MVLVIARVQTVRISQAFKEFVKKKKKQYFLSNSKENVLWIKAMTE